MSEVDKAAGRNTAPIEPGPSVTRRSLAPALQQRFREITITLFASSILVGVFAGLGALSGPMTFGPVVTVYGMLATFFGVVLTIMAAVAFFFAESDHVDIRGALGVFAFLVGSISTVSWLGVLAVALLLAAWMLGEAGRHQEDHQWRREFGARQEFFRRVRKADARSDPEAHRFLAETGPDLIERDKARMAAEVYEELPVSRRAAIDRDRMINGNPWSLPPD